MEARSKGQAKRLSIQSGQTVEFRGNRYKDGVLIENNKIIIIYGDDEIRNYQNYISLSKDTVLYEFPETMKCERTQKELVDCIVYQFNNFGKCQNVLIVTHSTTILQQVNNLIKLNTHKNKDELLKKYNYNELHLLDIKNVELYEIVDKKIYKCSSNKYGFICKYANDFLDEVLEETCAFQDE